MRLCEPSRARDGPPPATAAAAPASSPARPRRSWSISTPARVGRGSPSTRLGGTRGRSLPRPPRGSSPRAPSVRPRRLLPRPRSLPRSPRRPPLLLRKWPRPLGKATSSRRTRAPVLRHLPGQAGPAAWPIWAPWAQRSHPRTPRQARLGPRRSSLSPPPPTSRARRGTRTTRAPA